MSPEIEVLGVYEYEVRDENKHYNHPPDVIDVKVLEAKDDGEYLVNPVTGSLSMLPEDSVVDGDRLSESGDSHE